MSFLYIFTNDFLKLCLFVCYMYNSVDKTGIYIYVCTTISTIMSVCSFVHSFVFPFCRKPSSINKKMLITKNILKYEKIRNNQKNLSKIKFLKSNMYVTNKNCLMHLRLRNKKKIEKNSNFLLIGHGSYRVFSSS